MYLYLTITLDSIKEGFYVFLTVGLFVCAFIVLSTIHDKMIYNATKKVRFICYGIAFLVTFALQLLFDLFLIKRVGVMIFIYFIASVGCIVYGIIKGDED